MSNPIEELKALSDSDGDICPYDLDATLWTVIEEDDWCQDHKYQHGGFVVLHIASGRHFYVNRSRSGSYNTYWDYNASYLTEVKQVTKTITVTQWEEVVHG